MIEKKSYPGEKRRAAEPGWGGLLELQRSGGAEAGGLGQKWDSTPRGARRQPCTFPALSVSFMGLGPEEAKRSV